MTRYAKKLLKNMSYYEEKNQSTEIGPEMTQVKEFVVKNIQAAMITVFHVFEKLEDCMVSRGRKT